MHPKSFHHWQPGRICSFNRPPVYNQNRECLQILENAVKENLAPLAQRLHTHEDPVSVTHRLLSQTSIEPQQTRDARRTAPKQVWPFDSRYSAFLRHVYAPKLQSYKVLAALNQLPDSNTHIQASYIEAEHLETLISRSMGDPKLFPTVYTMLQQGQLPITAREHAQYVYHQFLLGGGSWRSTLDEVWAPIRAAADTGAYNTLLKLAYTARCKDTARLLNRHLTPDRFTYLVRLRYDKETPPLNILQEFSERRFVTDIVVVTSYLTSLVSSPRPENKRNAEAVFRELIKASKGHQAVTHSPHKLAGVLKALDTVNQSTQAKSYRVPLVADQKVFEKMYVHHVANAQHAEALEVLRSMAQHGHVLPRHLVRNHMKHTTLLPNPDGLLERLFYICCDANCIHPGFISDSLAELWAELICTRHGHSPEEAALVVNTNRSYIID